MGTRTLGIITFLLAGGCATLPAPDLRQTTAEITSCADMKTVEILEESRAMGAPYWVAGCEGQLYRCSWAQRPSCVAMPNVAKEDVAQPNLKAGTARPAASRNRS